MPDRDRIDRGIWFEGRVRDLLGGRLLPRSGGTWHSKGDVRGRIVVSCKAEATKSWNRVREQLREAIDMAFGTGAPAALALLDDDGEELVLMRLSDYVQTLEAGAAPSLTALDRGDSIRQLAETPAMLRDSA